MGETGEWEARTKFVGILTARQKKEEVDRSPAKIPGFAMSREERETTATHEKPCNIANPLE